MRVVGVGFGRTGTASMKVALERLGAGPCFHMLDVMQSQARARAWLAAARSQHPDWASLLAGYLSTMDWPADEPATHREHRCGRGKGHRHDRLRRHD